jgi:hypothetical protein
VNYSYFGNIYKKLTTLKLASLVMASFLVCILFSAYAFAQGSPKELENPFESKVLILGVRTAANEIGNDVKEFESNGFCGAFGEELEKKMLDKVLDKTEVIYKPVENNSLDRIKWKRYDGLRRNVVHVECGPNSKPSNPSDLSKWASDIKFSEKPFYTSGIKLLVKQSLLDSIELESIESAAEKLAAVLKKANILALKDTTTFSLLNESPLLFKLKSADSQADALDKLETSENSAYASDALIITTLFTRGVDEYTTSENETLRDWRPAYGAFENVNKYAIFPQDGSYLVEESEQYHIAIKDTTSYAGELMKVVDDTLNPDFVRKWRETLKKAEAIETSADVEVPVSRKQSTPNRFEWINELDGFALISAALIFLLLLLIIQSIQNHNRNTLKNTPKTENSVNVTVNPIIDLRAVKGGKKTSVIDRERELTADEIRKILDRISASTSSDKIAQNKAFVEGSDLHTREPSLNKKLIKALEVGSIAAIEKSISHPLAAFFIEGFKEMRNQVK